MTDFSDRSIYIGTMSGTSMDGLDLVALRFDARDRPVLVADAQVRYAPPLQQALLGLATDPDASVTRMCELDAQLGQFYAQQIEDFIHTNRVNKADIAAIGSHGQTIRHQTGGNHPYSLQIGDPNIIAARTGLCVVADFRRRDVALGGEGAPFAPAFHQQAFHSTAENRVIINIGGIANITYLPMNSEQSVIGYDTGPGNTLLDSLCRQALSRPHDENGELARNGRVDQDRLQQLIDNEPYFSALPPKSTGTDYFDLAWLQRNGMTDLKPQDALATLVELTAVSISRCIHELATPVGAAYACGGGVHNATLMESLRRNLSGIPLETTQALGIDPDLVEAMTFAWLARRTLQQEPGNLPSVTNAHKFTILGAVYY